jgi:hypothetical protein
VSGSRLPKVTASLNLTRTDDALNAFGLKLSQRSARFNDFGANEFTGPSALGVAPHNLAAAPGLPCGAHQAV